MGILSPTYDADLHFSDLVEVISHSWNPTMFNLDKLSATQLESHMVDGTFEPYWYELLAAYYDETMTRLDNMSLVLYGVLSKYLKHDENSKRPRHIYMPNVSQPHRFANSSSFLFTVWDDYQREYVFEMSFTFKEK